MANPNWVKGVSGNPKGKPAGIKNRETLLREERRAIFDQKVSEKWEQTIDQLPPTYIADQFLGKAPDKVDITTKGDKVSDIDIEALAIAMAEKLKEEKT